MAKFSSIKFLNRLKVNIKNSFSYIILGFFSIIIILPILWMTLTSFKTDADVYNIPPVWIPQFKIDNYIQIFLDRPFKLYINNSIIVAVAVTAICLTFGTLASYGFSGSKFRGSNAMFLGVIFSRMVPPVSFIIPFVIIFGNLGLKDTLFSLIVANTFFSLPFAIWVMKPFFDGIPSELRDAARIDGCNKIQLFFRVLLPIVKPGITAAAILSFLFSWKEFLFALALTASKSKTLPIGLTDFFIDEYIQWNRLAAANTISIIPAIVFIFLFQRYLVKGMLAGSVKG